MTISLRYAILFVVIVGFLPGSSATAKNVHPLFGFEDPSAGPFPSDRFTTPDDTQNSGLRVNLPKPDFAVQVSDCKDAVQVSDCEDIFVLNTLDGFNLQPRISIPFSGPIDVSTVNSKSVFLLSLGSTVPNGAAGGKTVGINQIVWDPETNTLHVESDELLDQHTRYMLIVTRGIRDAVGDPIEVSRAFDRFRHDLNFGQTKDPVLKAYRKALLDALHPAAVAGVHRRDILVASVFTTMSVTAVLEKIRDQIKAATPEPANFLLGPGSARTVFPLSEIKEMKWTRHNSATLPPSAVTRDLAQLRIIPGAVGTVAFGSYRSPKFRKDPNDDKLDGLYIPQVGTRTGTPAVQGEEVVYFNLFLPSATGTRRPPWPVVIYVPGCCDTDHKNNTPFNVAAALANHGIATIAINAAGQGFGPLGEFTVTPTIGTPVRFPAGGRSFDVNGDGVIEGGEGVDATSPRSILLGRDGRRQTIADLMQLVRVIEVGVDADGDGVADLDSARIYYAGFSSGAITGVPFVAIEPKVHAAVLNVPGGVISERLRLSPSNRAELGALLAGRVPSLRNVPGIDQLNANPDVVGLVPIGAPQFNENLPLRDSVPLNVRLANFTFHTVQSPVINTVPGAMEIQQVLERIEWAYMPVDAAAFASFLRKTPLPGAGEKSLIVQFASGDQTVPNPATTAILRAGDLADRTTLYRTDVAVDVYGTAPTGVEKNGHNFLVRLNTPPRTAIALAAQEQMALFFASDGATVIDPDGPSDGPCLPTELGKPGCLFEVPIDAPLPEDLNYIP